MNRKVIKPVVLSGLFLAALIVFSIITNQDNKDMTTAMKEATLPIVQFYEENNSVAQLHGYVSEMNITKMREEVFEDVKEALNAIDVNGITVSQVMGCGAQRGYKKRVRGTEVDVMMQPKIKFEIVVSSEEWEKATIDAIQKAAFTGEVGDGKIFSYEIRTATKIRTRESGADALN